MIVRMLYIIQRHCVVFPNVHAATEDQNDDTEDSIFETLECVSSQFQKNHKEVLWEMPVKR